jgi:hypothetical protein
MAESEDLQLERRRLRKEAKNAAKRERNKCPNRNRMVNDNFQIINQLGFCENHRQNLSRQLA